MVAPNPAAPDWTRERTILLTQHAAASNTTPDEALDALLALPPLRTQGPRRRWTEQELILLRNPRNKPRDIARQLGRTEASVSARRSQLAREEGIRALQNRRRSQRG